MIKLSRHARNNMRLYNIGRGDILEALKSSDVSDIEGESLIAIKSLKDRFSGLPLKVVYKKYGDDILVITAYPLKKKRWR